MEKSFIGSATRFVRGIVKLSFSEPIKQACQTQTTSQAANATKTEKGPQ